MSSPTSTSRVIAKARELVEATPEGIRYSELHRQILAVFPEIPPNTVHGALHRFRSDLPDEIYLPARGLYKHVRFRDDEGKDVRLPPSRGRKLSEEEFYEPFADWLVNELEECTKAIKVGGNTFRDKWGTPDVIGISSLRKNAGLSRIAGGLGW